MKKNLSLILSLIIICSSFLYADTPGLSLPKAGDTLFVGVVENRQKQLEKALQEREQLNKVRLDQESELKAITDDAKAQIDNDSKQLNAEPNNDFLKRKLTLLNELYQVVRDLSRDRERAIGILDDYIKVLQEFLDDPDGVGFKKSQRLGERLFYSFEDIQRLYNLILDQEKKVALISDEEKHAVSESENKKRVITATRDAYRAKKELIELGKYAESENINGQQRKLLIELEERIYAHRQQLDKLHVKESEYIIDLFSLRLSIAKNHLTLYKDYLRTIKPAVRVTEADIIHARETLIVKTNEYRKIKEQYRSDIDKVRVEKERAEQQLQEAAKKYGISLGREIAEWSKESEKSTGAYVAYCEVAYLQTEVETYTHHLEYLQAQVDLEDEKLKDQQLQVQVKESYHKKFTAEEEITTELKQYDAPKNESQAGLSRAKERVGTVADQLNTQKKVLDNIQALLKELEKQRDGLFKSSRNEYERCVQLIEQSEDLERDQIDMLSKLAGVYSGLSAIISSKLRLISFITGELESRTIWYRPEGAITWDGIKNVIPDTVTFLSYVRNYFTRGTIINTLKKAYETAQDPGSIAILALKLFILCVLLFLFYRILPRINNALIGVADRGVGRFVSLLFAGIAGFIYAHFFAISLWVVVFSALIFQDVVDSYLYILFYLLSIPYLLYLANRFISFMAQFNETHQFALIAEDFQRRFWFVLSVFMFATITIFFFREAFMLAHYYRSELPTILLALNYIIGQVALIFLIDKELILSFIPTKNDFWLWAREQIDRFYYLMLLMVIAIIVMSNPYVGFGRLVLYGLFGLIYSIALLLVLYWLHGLFKRMASRAFFFSVEDVARERFANAKTWFGIAIILSFLILSFIGAIIAAKIWGWPITLSKITDFLYYPIIGEDTKNPIHLVTFFNILIFFFIGVVAAYGLNKFVLERIFDLLLVDPGVQHTVSSITQYLVIIAAVFLGFQNAKLGGLVNYIVAALVFGLGWILKDPIGDFIAYFIILVQRPIKIGDLIKIDSETVGVVRKITARAVILRRKNSTTLVVPNSVIISKVITNWNYARNFIAFDDIIVLVDYAEDPEKVRSVLYDIVAEHPNILKNPKPWIRLDGFGEYGYEFMVRGFISSVYTLEKWEIASNIRINIAKRFDELGIKLALPTRLLLTRTNKNGHSLDNFEPQNKE